MELETGHPLCSLCRRELSNFTFENGLDAKLCEGCRGLIQTALHPNAARAVVQAAAGAQPSESVAYLHSGVASPVGSVQSDSPVLFDGLSVFGETSELPLHTEVFNLHEGSFEMGFDEESPESLESDGISVETPVLEPIEPHDDAPTDANPSSESHPQELESDSAIGLGADLSELHLSLSDNGNFGGQSLSVATNPLTEPGVQTERSSNACEDAQSTAEAAMADPWEEPLPPWDYSRNEYPVLMGPPRESSFAKYKVPFAVVLILVFAAGFYYFIYPQISRDQPSPSEAGLMVRTPEAADPPRAPANSAAPSQTQAASSDATAATDAKPALKTDSQGAVASETSNAQGRFALQAAAFPTQEGAAEFAEKLKNAGIPSYVVSADLSHRGRWFRVRVGRFNTAEEAQRFAAEAQLRAKAAGLSLQLIVSSYDQS